MAYDYDVDILAALWTGAEDAEEPYASFIAANPDITNEVSENRILSTIELLRSHMELLASRDEANLLHFAISRLIRHTAGGSNPWSDEAAVTTAIGNVLAPVFPAGASLEITNERDGSTACPISVTGGDTATVVAELNSTLLFAGVAEMTDITVTAADVGGSTSGTHFFISDTTTDYYLWMDVAARAQVASFNTFDFLGICPPPAAGVVAAPGMTNATLSRAVGDAIVVDDPGLGPHYFWFAIAGDAELTSITYPEASVFTRATTPGVPTPGDYWTFEEALDGGANTPYYVWYRVSPSPETFTATCPADVGGSLNGTYWELEDAPTTTKEHYVWYCVARAEETSVTAIADVGGSLGGTHFTLNSALDATAYYAWMFHPGRADVTNGSITGATASAIGAATYDFDVTIDGGALQTLSIVLTGGETYSAIAALMSAVVVGGTVVYDDPAFAFRVESSSGTDPSSVLVAAGTAGSGGGDLFAALDAADSVTHTFSAPVTASDPAPGGTGIQVTYAIDDTAMTIGGALRSDIGALGDFGTSGAGVSCVITNAAVGATTDAADVDTGFTVTVTTDGITAAADPAPGGTGLKVSLVGDEAPSVVATATRAVIDASPAFSAPAPVGAVITVTTATPGAVVDAADTGGSGVVLAVTTQGNDLNTDPAPGGTGIMVAVIGTDIDSVVRSSTQSAISGGSSMTFTGVAGATHVLNGPVGAAADTADVSASLVAVTKTQEGVDTSTDPGLPGLDH